MSSYEPRIGDYGVVRTKGIAPFLIRVGTWSHWNHAFIYIGDGQIIEANVSGIEISSVDKYKRIVWNRHEHLTPKQRKLIVEHAKSKVGVPYGFLTVGIITLRILGLKTLANMKWIRRLAEKEGYICSELVAESYIKSGIVLPKADYLTTPDDLEQRILFL